MDELGKGLWSPFFSLVRGREHAISVLYSFKIGQLCTHSLEYVEFYKGRALCTVTRNWSIKFQLHWTSQIVDKSYMSLKFRHAWTELNFLYRKILQQEGQAIQSVPAFAWTFSIW